MASGGSDLIVIIWNLENSAQIYKFKGFTDAVLTVAFSPDGKTLAAGSCDKTIKIWNLETGAKIK